MKANIKVGQVASVAMNTLESYPTNPRRGDIEAIAQSLKAHGQYRPIVVQYGTNFILAGNHTYKAAKKLGWKKIKITYIEVDEESARRIVLADNRITDLATYNEPLLKSLLTTLPELEGTGFTQAEVETLDRLMNGKEKDNVGGSKSLPSDPEVKISAWKFTVESTVYKAWREQLYTEFPTKQKALREIKSRLGLPERKPIEPEPSGERSEVSAEDIETVAINEIKIHPLNPREGDIGAIIESLTHMGQYRPIVVNKATKHILSGNHTYQGALQ
jgi:ParB-like chromosome segregation protein Spo0J